MRALMLTALLALACGGADDGAGPDYPTRPTSSGSGTVLADATACVQDLGGEFVFEEYFAEGEQRYQASYGNDFRNTCDFDIRVFAVGCFTRDGVRAPGCPTGTRDYAAESGFPLAAGETARAWFGLGNEYQGRIEFEILVRWNACRSDSAYECDAPEPRWP